MTTQKIAQHPSPACRCHDCIVEFVKDWEDDYAIDYSSDKFYSDEYTGPFQSNTSRYDW